MGPTSSPPAAPVMVAAERTLCVPPGHLVHTAYVPAHRVRLACTDRMAVGDVDAAYRRQLQLGAAQAWPPPVGYWEEDANGGRIFVITDGRHEHVAKLMLGFREVFVAWVGPRP